MQLLDFVLDDFTRVAWVSAEAQHVWEPRVEAITRAWDNIERLAVVDGLRVAALQSLTPQALVEVSGWAAEKGLSTVALGQQGRAEGYSASSAPFDPSKPWNYRVAIVEPDFSPHFLEAWRSGNDENIGMLLGFPVCCRRFFKRVWVDAKRVDTTWEMALETWKSGIITEPLMGMLQGESISECNILLRWLGVRMIPHLPCSFNCEATKGRGQQYAKLFIRYGYKKELHWIQEMLRWSVEWSALHGIAEIKTPVCKIAARTDATPSKYTVRLHGDYYPSEGASGLEFPYQMLKTDRFRDLSPIDSWTDNGFKDADSMRKAHTRLIDVVLPFTRDVATIVDLGCGNGRLLSLVLGYRPALEARGIEKDADKIGRGRLRYPGVSFEIADLWETQIPYECAVLISGNRLKEQFPNVDKCWQGTFFDTAKYVILYSYDNEVDLASLGNWSEKWSMASDVVHPEVGIRVLVREK